MEGFARLLLICKVFMYVLLDIIFTGNNVCSYLMPTLTRLTIVFVAAIGISVPLPPFVHPNSLSMIL